MTYTQSEPIILPPQEEGVDYLADRKILARHGSRLVVWHKGHRRWNRISGHTYHQAALKLQDLARPGLDEMQTLFEGRFATALLKKHLSRIATFLNVPAEAVIEITPDKTLTIDMEDSLIRRWLDWQPALPSHLEPHLALWREHLDEGRIAAYAAAASGLIRRMLLDAADPTEMPRAWLRGVHSEPFVEIQAAPTAVLYRAFGPDAPLRIGVPIFSRQIAQRCAEIEIFGELAWRYLAASLEYDGALLPYLETTRHEHSYTLELQCIR